MNLFKKHNSWVSLIQKLPFLIGFLILWTSCNKDQKDHNSLLYINIDKSFTNEITLDSIVDNYSLIELETNDEHLLATITEIDYLDNRFYISDSRSSTFMAVDTCGNVIYKLSSVGRGPYGFSDIYDFKVDNNHNIYVLSGFKGIVIFDSTGSYVSSINYNSESINYAGTIYAFGLTGTGDFYLWNGTLGIDKDNYQGTYHIYRFTQDKKVSESYLPIEHGFTGSYKIFYGSEGNYLLQSLPGNDTIYRADHSGISPAYYVDFGKTKIPKNSLPSSYENYLREYFKLRTETNFSTSINSPLETETFIYFQFMNSLTTRSAFYSFSTGKVITGTLPFRDILGWPSFNCTFNNKLVGYIEPSKISSISSEKVEKFSRLEKEIYNKLLKTDLNNNPILLILQIKNF
jgi:hypothetical protein